MADKKPKVNGKNVKIIKKPLGERFAETFFGGTVKDAKAYTLHEIIVPAIKNLVYESFTGALDRLLNGGNGRTGYSNYSRITSGGVSIFTPQTVSYNSVSAMNTKQKPAIGGYSSRNPETIVFYDVSDANGKTLRSRDRAAGVLAQMQNQIMSASYVTVSDYYDFAEVTAGGFTDDYYGWRDLSMARIMPKDGGHVIILPPTEQVR